MNPRYGIRSLFLLPLGIFIALYSWRFYTDVHEGIPLGYLSVQVYAVYIFGISFAGLLAALCLDIEDLEKINPDILIVAFLLAALALFRNSELTLNGSDGRLASGITGPIGLGHCAASGLLICICTLGSHKLHAVRTGLIAVTSALCLALLIRAASRSPVLAVVVVVGLLLIVSVAARNIRMVSTLIACGMLAVVTAFAFQPNDSRANVDRISLTFDNYLNLENSAKRDFLFAAAIDQFKTSPWTGYALEEQDVGDRLFYPHNIFLEAFMSTGVFGGIGLAFSGLLGVVIALWIFYARPALSWLAAVHLQMLIFSCLSGAIATDSGYWFTLGAMLCCLRKMK